MPTAPKLNPLQKREAAMSAIANIARKQVVGKSGVGIGRKKILRRSEEARLVQKNKELLGAVRRLGRAPSSAAGTTAQIHQINKIIRRKAESPEGLKVKMKGGHEYTITVSSDVEKGRLGMKQAARGAVRQEVEEVQEQREELVAREQENTQNEQSKKEKRREQAKQKQSAWRKGEFGTIGENAESTAPAQTSAAPTEMNVSISEQYEDHSVGMSDDDTDDSDSGGGPEDMPIA